MNKKHIKEKTVYEFDIDSFQKNQAYQITLPTIGLQQSTYIGLLLYADISELSFMVICDIYNDREEIKISDDSDYGILKIDIDDYMEGNISILKLGVIENE